MFGDNIWCSLPLEIVKTIFGFLGRDILSAVLVNNDWKKFLNDKLYWKNFQIRMDNNNLNEVLKSERLKVAGGVKLFCLPSSDMPGLFRIFAKNRTLQGKSLHILDRIEPPSLVDEGLKYVNPDDLSNVVSTLIQFEAYITLTSSQMEHTIDSITQSPDTNLKYFNAERGFSY